MFAPRGGSRFNPLPGQMPADHGGQHQQRQGRLGYNPTRPYARPAQDSGTEYDGRRLRKSLVRKTVDYNAAVIKWLQVNK